MRASEFVLEMLYAGREYRQFVQDSGQIVTRQKNKSGWSAPFLADEQDASVVVRHMKDWIEKASGKPLWQALRDGTTEAQP